MSSLYLRFLSQFSQMEDYSMNYVWITKVETGALGLSWLVGFMKVMSQFQVVKGDEIKISGGVLVDNKITIMCQS